MTYKSLCEEVLRAQLNRISVDEEHTPSCTHSECEKEREIRRVMETTPEHFQAQQQWKRFLLELRDASLSDNESPDDVA